MGALDTHMIEIGNRIFIRYQCLIVGKRMVKKRRFFWFLCKKFGFFIKKKLKFFQKHFKIR